MGLNPCFSQIPNNNTKNKAQHFPDFLLIHWFLFCSQKGHWNPCVPQEHSLFWAIILYLYKHPTASVEQMLPKPGSTRYLPRIISTAAVVVRKDKNSCFLQPAFTPGPAKEINQGDLWSLAG